MINKHQFQSFFLVISNVLKLLQEHVISMFYKYTFITASITQNSLNFIVRKEQT